jgi:hypothetical protein
MFSGITFLSNSFLHELNNTKAISSNFTGLKNLLANWQTGKLANWQTGEIRTLIWFHGFRKIKLWCIHKGGLLWPSYIWLKITNASYIFKLIPRNKLY